MIVLYIFQLHYTILVYSLKRVNECLANDLIKSALYISTKL